MFSLARLLALFLSTINHIFGSWEIQFKIDISRGERRRECEKKPGQFLSSSSSRYQFEYRVGNIGPGLSWQNVELKSRIFRDLKKSWGRNDTWARRRHVLFIQFWPRSIFNCFSQSLLLSLLILRANRLRQLAIFCGFGTLGYFYSLEVLWFGKVLAQNFVAPFQYTTKLTS